MGVHFRGFPPVNLDVDFLDGFLAGDGYLRQARPTWNARGIHYSSKLGYVEYVKLRFEQMGLPVSDISVLRRTSNAGHSRPGGYTYHAVSTHAHPALTEQFHRWYPSGHKLFPPDFHISSDSLLQWYLGDGSLHRGCSPLITAYVPTVGDIDKLMSRLHFLGSITLHRHSNSGCRNIYFSGSAARRFFDFIGPCPVPEYQYRWPV